MCLCKHIFFKLRFAIGEGLLLSSSLDSVGSSLNNLLNHALGGQD